MIKFIIYTQHACDFCNKAKQLLIDEEYHYEERLLDTPEKIKRFRDAGHKTVPQIFLHIGGHDELYDYLYGDINFNPDPELVEKTKPTAKILPFKGKIGAISGSKEDKDE